MCQTVPIWLRPRRSMFVSLINFGVIFDFIYFRFRPSKAKLIGNVLPSRQNTAIEIYVFFSFIMRIAYWRTESVYILRQCAANCKKSPQNTNWKLKTLQILLSKCLMARGASLRQYNGAEITVPSLVLTQRFIYVRGGSRVSPFTLKVDGNEK